MAANVLDDVPEAVAYLDPNTYSIVYANRRFLLYFSPNGKDVSNKLNFVEDLVHHDERKRTKLAFSLLAEAGFREDVWNPPRLLDLGTLTSGEESMPKHRNFDWSLAKDGSGRIIVSGRMVNVVDEHRRKAEEEFKDFFDNAPIALHWLGGTGHVMWANKTEMATLGYTAEEYIGQPIMKFCPDEEELVLEIFKALGSGATIRDVPVRFRTKEGKIVHLLIDSNVNYTADGQFNHTRCFIRDDTGRKVRESRAKAIQESYEVMVMEKDRFLRNLLHEIRTPMHTLLAAVDLALDASEGSIPKDVADSSEDVNQILEDFAYASRFDSGKVYLPKNRPFSVEGLLNEIAFDARRRVVQGTAVSVEVSVGAGLFIESDKVLLRHVLRHLARNGVAHSKNGCVTISAEAEQLPPQADQAAPRARVTIRVTNPGAKVSEEEINKAFQKYWTPLQAITSDGDIVSGIRTDSGMKLGAEANHGLGLGLNTSYNMVACMGGELRANVLSEYTEFWFSLEVKMCDSTSVRSGSFDSSRDNSQVSGSNNDDSNISEGTGATSVFKQRGKVEKEEEDCATSTPKRAGDHDDPFGPAAPNRALRRRTSINHYDHRWVDVGETTEGHNAVTDRHMVGDIDDSMAVDAAAPGGKRGSGGAPKASKPTVGIDASKKPHVLVVEDNTICQKVCASFLKAIGCTSEIAVNGQEGVDKVKASIMDLNPSTFDLVLMDLRMPIMDGFEATRIIKQELALAIPVVGLTAEFSPDVEERCLGLGMSKMLGKPVNRGDLKAALAQYIDLA